MGRLTTHVLDTSTGLPAAGMSIELYHPGTPGKLLLETVTNTDGRVDEPLLQGDAFRAGEYELVFLAGDYFDRQGLTTDEPRFLDRVVIRFGVSDESVHYHVPLLLSPFGYSTYRGS